MKKEELEAKQEELEKMCSRFNRKYDFYEKFTDSMNSLFSRMKKYDTEAVVHLLVNGDDMQEEEARYFEAWWCRFCRPYLKRKTKERQLLEIEPKGEDYPVEWIDPDYDSMKEQLDSSWSNLMQKIRDAHFGLDNL